MAGKKEADGLSHTQMIGGKHYSILTMLMEFLDEHANLVKEATLFSCAKRLEEELGEKENLENKEQEAKELLNII
mgnify:CR=1 FL=1